MIPILHEIRKFKELFIWETKDHRIGFAADITPCDLEISNAQDYYNKIVPFLRNLDSRILVRVTSHEETKNSELPLVLRNRSFLEIDHVKRSVWLTVEVLNEPAIITKVKSFLKKDKLDDRLNLITDTWTLLKQSGLQFTPCDKEQTQKLFLNPDYMWIKNGTAIANGNEVIGVIRQVKPGHFPISFDSLQKVTSKLPRPFKVCVSLRKMNFAKMRLDLEKRLKQSDVETSSVKSQLINESAISAIEHSIKEGSQFFEYEFLITLSREDDALLTSDIKNSLSQLSEIGDMAPETYGVAPSFMATLPGNNQHVTLLEADQVLPLLLPIWVNGEPSTPQFAKPSLVAQRFDGTLTSFNLFGSEFNVSNTVVIGTSGKGKSVLTGLLTQSLLNDPCVQVIKIDVGGSHSKECELLNGTEHVLKLDSSSGINPFYYVDNKEISKPEKINIISKFLSILIQEQGETQLSKDLRERIESSVSTYIEKAKDSSLQNFYDTQIEFPRRNLLKRWVNGGVFENAFKKPTEINDDEKRLRYYNFSQVFQASDPDFAQAGMAAVLAQFNFETLINKEKRIVLICDETPFLSNPVLIFLNSLRQTCENLDTQLFLFPNCRPT